MNSYAIEPRTLPDLPAGYTARAARLDEVEELIKPTWAIDAIYNSSPRFSLQDFAADLNRPNFNLATDSQAIFAPNGDCAAYADVFAETPFIRNFLFVSTHPNYANLGLGTWLTRWGINRLSERISDAPPTYRFGISSYPYTRDVDALTLLENEGFTFERVYYEMAIDFTDGTGRTIVPIPAPLPEGIALRTFNPERDADALFEAYIASFRDHFGYVERPRETAYARWRHMIFGHPTYDPNLITLAEHEGKVVAFSVTWLEEDTPGSYGYVQHLGTIREWRRRGLGRALLTRVFATFYERGAPGVMLGVDAASPTGALHLYEQAGMYVKSSTTSVSLLLREGEEPAVLE